MEEWKDIEGYEGLYQVSSLGRIRSLGRTCGSKNKSVQRKRQRILTQEVTIHGYCRVRLYDADGNAKHYAVHRLVYDTFIGLKDKGNEVNHINEIKTDNRLQNLEECSDSYNCNYGTRNKRIADKLVGVPLSKDHKNKIATALSEKVIQLTPDGNVIHVYDSAKVASELTGIDAGHICSCKNGKRRTAGGYVWRRA